MLNQLYERLRKMEPNVRVSLCFNHSLADNRLFSIEQEPTWGKVTAKKQQHVLFLQVDRPRLKERKRVHAGLLAIPVNFVADLALLF